MLDRPSRSRKVKVDSGAQQRMLEGEPVPIGEHAGGHESRQGRLGPRRLEPGEPGGVAQRAAVT